MIVSNLPAIKESGTPDCAEINKLQFVPQFFPILKDEQKNFEIENKKVSNL